MTKTLFIEDIKPGTTAFDEIFSIKEIQQHKAKNGDPYFRVILQDRTGTVQAKIWRDAIGATSAETLAAGDVISADVEASEYNGELQLSIKKAIKTTDYATTDLMKMSTKDLDGMYNQLVEKLESIKDEDIKRLTLSIAKDATIREKLKYAIAGEIIHHDYVGGLLEHTLEVMAIAETVISLYPKANRSIIIAGILLHDIGKIYELGIEQTNFIRTLQGYLIGHINIGMRILNQFIPKDFPEQKRMEIEHIILSHHREIEFGAAIRPATLEAIIVAMADDTSSKVRIFQKELDEGNKDSVGLGKKYNKFTMNRVYHDTTVEK
ncbi:HD domain-containing protein [bacterium]|nr:HD domain-containing protein [bacterium]